MTILEHESFGRKMLHFCTKWVSPFLYTNQSSVLYRVVKWLLSLAFSKQKSVYVRFGRHDIVKTLFNEKEESYVISVTKTGKWICK